MVTWQGNQVTFEEYEYEHTQKYHGRKLGNLVPYNLVPWEENQVTFVSQKLLLKCLQIKI